MVRHDMRRHDMRRHDIHDTVYQCTHRYTSRYDFVANATRLVYTDPRKIVSSSSVYYFTVDAGH
jgi:hypothetical protein